MASEKAGLLHTPDYLRGMAEQFRLEADRADARAAALESGEMEVSCGSGCWNILSTCIQVQPL